MSTHPFWLKLLPERLGVRIRGKTRLLAIVHNTGWLFADKALRMAVGVVVGAWMARYLGPSQFGELAYILSFVAFFSVVAQLGLDAVAVRDIARDETRSPEILGTVLRLRVMAGFLSWLVAIVAIRLLRPGDNQALLLVAVAAATLVLQSADTVDLWFQSQTQSRRTVVSKSYAFLAASALKVMLIVSKASLVAFVFVGVVELAISACILWWSYRNYPAPLRWRWSRSQAVALLRECAPYLLAGLAVLIYMRIDQLMLRDMIGEHELGLYSAALPLSTALHFIPMALCSSIAPAMARLRQGQPEAYERAVGQLFSAMWWIMIPLATLVAALSIHLIHMLYGPAYAASAPMLAVHVFASVPVALGVAQSVWIVNEGRNMISLYRTMIGAFCNVALNLLLIPRFGGLGAALASVVAQAAAAILSNIVLAPRMFRIQMSSLINFKLRMPAK
jgi:O-antigen/teichoic acid export membrane protein